MRSIILALSLIATTAAHADGSQWSASKRPIGYGGDMWVVTLTSRSDDLDVRGVDFNRGNCRSNLMRGNDFPHPLRFGQQVAMSMTDCDPVEMRVKTRDGIETIEMPE